MMIILHVISFLTKSMVEISITSAQKITTIWNVFFFFFAYRHKHCLFVLYSLNLFMSGSIRLILVMAVLHLPLPNESQSLMIPLEGYKKY